jgi:hypothetical protein
MGGGDVECRMANVKGQILHFVQNDNGIFDFRIWI